jgi:hypothetical protein
VSLPGLSGLNIEEVVRRVKRQLSAFGVRIVHRKDLELMRLVGAGCHGEVRLLALRVYARLCIVYVSVCVSRAFLVDGRRRCRPCR